MLLVPGPRLRTMGLVRRACSYLSLEAQKRDLRARTQISEVGALPNRWCALRISEERPH